MTDTIDRDPLVELRVTVPDVKRAYAALEDLIQHPSTRPSDDVRRTTLTGSSPAWHSQAAYLVLELGQLARDAEARLLTNVTDHARPRGGSDRNTFLALDAALGLAPAAAVEEQRGILHLLNRWLSAALTCLGEVEPWARLPRLPGGSEPRCPWCHFTTLRYQAYAGQVRCVNPECADDEGRHPKGRIEFGAYSGEPLLAWSDGSTGLDAVPA